MGIRSKERIKCSVVLSVTNAFLSKIKDAVRKANFNSIIKEKTHNNALVLDERWRDDGGFLGMINRGTGITPVDMFLGFTGFGAAAKVSWTDVHINYEIEVDMYHIIRHKTNKIVAHMLKILPAVRRRLIHKEMAKEIKKGFKENISKKAGIFSGISGLAVSVKSVSVSRLV